MNIKNIIKKAVPEKVKSYIKNEIGNYGSTDYIVRLSDSKRFSDKAIIVTGGTGAIGSAICQKLVSDGATVGCCGRNRDKLLYTVERLNKNVNGKAIPIFMDVLDDNNVENAINSFSSEYGGLYAIVNNAGGSARDKSKNIVEQDIEVIDSVLNLNLRGCIVCSQKASKIMIGNNCGRIVNISSVVGMCGKAGMSDYAAAKAGIIGFTKSLAIELAPYGITVNSVSPGMVNQTPFDAGLPNIQTEKNCLHRKGYTDEVASAVTFVLSDESSYITGQNFVVDGGRTLGLYGD
ncbi:MAG: SDR family oxidoreductase [Clostridiales bacterium]|nr:SDR family oxidoreductase [Clostridiales bacterium]